VYYLMVKWMDWLLVGGLLMIAIGVGINLKEKVVATPVQVKKAETVAKVTVPVDKYVVVDIAGEVIKPGVYRLPKGSRVSDLLAVSGGLSAGADRDWVEKNMNRAKILNDGEKIYIPGKTQNTNIKTQNTNQILGATSGIININTAGIEELDRLSGVGPAIAQRIIDYREKNDGFRDINEIKLVSGIGESLFEKIKDQIGI
jgi:competence protein ComEA